MTTAAWTLVFLIGAIAVMVVMILVYEPKPGKEAGEDTEKIPVISEEAVRNLKQLQKTIDVRWPQMKVLMEKQEFEHGILYHWAGLHGNGKTLLFQADEEISMSRVMEAVVSIELDHLVPANDFYICICSSEKDREKLIKEVSGWLHSRQVNIDMLLCEKEAEAELIEGQKKFILAGYGHAASMVITGLAPEDAGKIQFPYSFPSFTVRQVGKILPFLPFRLRMQWRLFRRKAAKNIIRMIPLTEAWFRPVLTICEEGLLLTAQDDRSREDALEKIREYAERAGKEVRVIREAHCAEDDNEAVFAFFASAVSAAYDVSAVVPVLSEKPYSRTGWHTVGFSPSGSTDAAIAFYRKLLVK